MALRIQAAETSLRCRKNQSPWRRTAPPRPRPPPTSSPSTSSRLQPVATPRRARSSGSRDSTSGTTKRTNALEAPARETAGPMRRDQRGDQHEGQRRGSHVTGGAEPQTHSLSQERPRPERCGVCQLLARAR